ncbi:hypothetical protein C5N14_21850 [Micromonospora sp. MW-13]|nr:hypothetical protein C5N14_21850 [Micromonospora sp. MW-13]
MSDSDGHVWQTRSRHRTSEGTLYYQSCHCGLWRICAGPAAGIPVWTRRARSSAGGPEIIPSRVSPSGRGRLPSPSEDRAGPRRPWSG